MRRYFFDVRDGGDVIPDEEGMELSTIDAAQNEATRALADMARDEVRTRNGNGSACDLIIEVRDDDGPVMRAKFTFEIDHLQ
jgi:hypothetical protein